MLSLGLVDCFAVVWLFACIIPLIHAEPSFCNQNTSHECRCSDCWDTVAAEESIDWISISIEDCAPNVDEALLRRKLAGWANEECNSVLNCQLSSPLTENHILIGSWSCLEEKKEIRILLLRNETGGITTRNTLPASLLGQVIQSRQHLLSFLLYSELQSVTVLRRLPSSSRDPEMPLGKPPIFFVAATLIVSILVISIIVYFTHIYVNWRSIVRGKWNNKEYRPVMHVRYTTQGEYIM